MLVDFGPSSCELLKCFSYDVHSLPLGIPVTMISILPPVSLHEGNPDNLQTKSHPISLFPAAPPADHSDKARSPRSLETRSFTGWLLGAADSGELPQFENMVLQTLRVHPFTAHSTHKPMVN